MASQLLQGGGDAAHIPVPLQAPDDLGELPRGWVEVDDSLREPQGVIPGPAEHGVAVPVGVAANSPGCVIMLYAQGEAIRAVTRGRLVADVATPLPPDHLGLVLRQGDPVEPLKLVAANATWVGVSPRLVDGTDGLRPGLAMSICISALLDGAHPALAPGGVAVDLNDPAAAPAKGGTRGLFDVIEVVLGHEAAEASPSDLPGGIGLPDLDRNAATRGAVSCAPGVVHVAESVSRHAHQHSGRLHVLGLIEQEGEKVR